MDLEAAKRLVRDHHAALDAARPGEARQALGRHCADAMAWSGMHPWGVLHGLDALAAEVWEPLRAALGPLQRRPDVFLAGHQEGYARPGTWVMEMGHLMGLHDRPWLGIPPTRRLCFLRYAEFSRVEGGRIAEQALYLDIPFLMAQAGRSPFARHTGALVLTPGPRTHDGLLWGPQDPEEGRRTLALVDRMVSRLVGEGVRTTGADLRLDWRPDMLWWGPAGIGATYTHGRYLEQHCRPFEEGLRFLRHDGHETRVAEGSYGAFFGYPSLILTAQGGYLGVTTASEREFEMRIVDVYRREGELLAENWIFIDHLHVLAQLGFDALARMAA